MIAIKKDDNGVAGAYSYANITTQTTTLVKTGAGFLHSITFNKPTATGTVEIDDALTHTSPIIGTVTTPANPMPVTLIYDIYFFTGLSITTGTANQDITISYV
jgi:hypothetical protein